MKDGIFRSFRALSARTIYATANFFVSVFDNALSVHLERLRIVLEGKGKRL